MEQKNLEPTGNDSVCTAVIGGVKYGVGKPDHDQTDRQRRYSEPHVRKDHATEKSHWQKTGEYTDRTWSTPIVSQSVRWLHFFQNAWAKDNVPCRDV